MDQVTNARMCNEHGGRSFSSIVLQIFVLRLQIFVLCLQISYLHNFKYSALANMFLVVEKKFSAWRYLSGVKPNICSETQPIVD